MISVLGLFHRRADAIPSELQLPRPWRGRRCVALREASSGSAVPFEADEEGTVGVAIHAVDGFGMYLVLYD